MNLGEVVLFESGLGWAERLGLEIVYVCDGWICQKVSGLGMVKFTVVACVSLIYIFSFCDKNYRCLSLCLSMMELSRCFYLACCCLCRVVVLITMSMALIGMQSPLHLGAYSPWHRL